MKYSIAFILSVMVSVSGLSQDLSNHDVRLDGKSWTQLSPKQLVDSVNMNQTGNEQWEYLKLYSNIKDVSKIESIILSHNYIKELAYEFDPGLDITKMSATDVIEPIHGFYYSIDNEGFMDSYDAYAVIQILYPRSDRY